MTKCEKCGKEFKNLSVHQRFCGIESGDKVNKVSLLDIFNRLETVVDVLSGFNERIENIEKVVEPEIIKAVPIITTGIAITPDYNPEKDETYPKSYIPREYRKLVDEILSPEFGAQIDDQNFGLDFEIKVIVPDAFSSLTPKEKEQGIKDIRSRIIPRALGENGVRDWCNLIRNNLNKYFTQTGKASPFK